MLRILSVAWLVLASLGTGADTITLHKVSDQLHILTGKDYGTNIGVIAVDDSLILIDPMPGEDKLADLQQAVLSISAWPVKYVLNTHAHEDHSGGNAYFLKQGALLAAPDTAITGVQRYQVKSHSANDVIYYHQAGNSLFVGDVFDTSWHPTFYAGGLNGFNEAIETILSIGNDDTLIIPGHGKPAGKTALRQYQQDTNGWVNAVKALHSQGQNAEQIQQSQDIQALVIRFNPALPEKAVRRFIERTISLIEQGQ